MSKNTKSRILNTRQEHIYGYALRNIVALQNRDGSWGNKQEAVVLTAQAVQLMIALGYSLHTPNVQKALHWLDSNINKGDKHWTTLLEIGLKTERFNEFLREGDIQDFVDDLNKYFDDPMSSSLDFYWDVLPTLIALFPYEDDYTKKTNEVIPHEKVINRINTECKDPDGIYMSIDYKPNNTGLVALYYMTIAKKRKFAGYKEKARAMIRWLIECRNIDDNDELGSGINWLGSRSITSYILIDLHRCLDNNDPIRKYFKDIIRFITPKENGLCSYDRYTTYNSNIHANPLYITILSCRAMAEVLRTTSPKSFDGIIEKMEDRDFFKDLDYRWTYFKICNPGFMPYLICCAVVLIGIGIVGTDLNGGVRFQIGLMIISAGVATALSVYITTKYINNKGR